MAGLFENNTARRVLNATRAVEGERPNIQRAKHPRHPRQRTPTTTLVSQEPAAPGQTFTAAIDGVVSNTREYVNATGRFISHNANMEAIGDRVITADTSTVIALEALIDNPTSYNNFGHDWSSGSDDGRPANFDQFSLVGLHESKTYDPMADNEFEVTFFNLPPSGTIMNGDVVAFALRSNWFVADIGELQLTYLGPLSLDTVGGGGGSVDFCDPPTAAGEPDRVLGYSGTCSNPGWYMPSGTALSVMASGTCIVAPGTAPVVSESYSSIDFAAGIIVNRTGANSIQVGAGIIASELAGTTTADTSFTSTNPKNEIRYRSGLRITDTGSCTMDVFSGATAVLTEAEPAGGSVNAATLYHQLEFVDGLLVDDRGNGELRIGTNSAYVLVKGNPSANFRGTGVLTLTGVVRLIGKAPATTLLVTVTEDIDVKTTDTVYAFYDKTNSPNQISRWRYASAFGITQALRGYENYNAAGGIQALIQESGDIKWSDTIVCNVSPPP